MRGCLRGAAWLLGFLALAIWSGMSCEAAGGKTAVSVQGNARTDVIAFTQENVRMDASVTARGSAQTEASVTARGSARTEVVAIVQGNARMDESAFGQKNARMEEIGQMSGNADKEEEWQEQDPTDAFLAGLELDKLDDAFDGLGGQESFRFSDAVKKLIEGEMPLTLESLGQIMKDAFFSQISQGRKMAVQILLLLAVAAIFTNFAGISEKSQASDISFYMMYLVIFTLLMQSFRVMEQMTADALERVLTFVKLLMPSCFLASVFASGTVSGLGFYELTFGFILLMQWALKYVVMPAISLYVLLSMVNHITQEDYLSHFAELLKTFVEWVLKTLAAVSIGLQTVQSLVLPAVDALKTAILGRTVGSIPGIGNIFSGVTEVVLGSAVLIKNAVGAAGLIFLVLLCLAPLLKLLFLSLLYRLLAAVAQPVSDKRMVECIGGVGEGAGLLMKVLLTVGMLFFLSIALATAAVKGG